jgi:hypothetical protein
MEQFEDGIEDHNILAVPVGESAEVTETGRRSSNSSRMCFAKSRTGKFGPGASSQQQRRTNTFRVARMLN